MANEGAFAVPTAGRATIQYGVYSENTQIAGKTIKELRAIYGKLWSIPQDATAYKGKEAMTEDYIVKPNDTVEFFRKQGEKGLIHRLIVFVSGLLTK